MKLGLYIHIPFCKQKCLYCDFNSFPNINAETVKLYISALVSEIINNSLKYKQYEIDTVFIGGGTPTFLSCNYIKEILNAIKANYNISDNAEISIEANPGTIDEEGLYKLYSYGINRISFGLQSTSDKILKTLGRIHSFSDFLSCFHYSRKAGFKNINIDLMYGIPGQSVSDFTETLKIITELAPEHISSYSLIVEEGTPYFKMYNEGTLILPEEDDERRMYHESLKILQESLYHQYEISNFSKERMECKHNLKYWGCDEYIGFGTGAHSYFHGKRWSNTYNINDYIKFIKTNSNKISEAIITNYEVLSENDMISEFMFMNLRKIKGVDIKEFTKRFKNTPESYFHDQIAKFQAQGLLINDNDYIRLSPLGIEFSNLVMCEFII